MYSYRPHKKTLSSFVSLAQFEPKRPKVGAANLAVILVLGIIGGVLVWQLPNRLVYARRVADLPKPEQVVLPTYTKHVDAQTDVNKLAQTGGKLLDHNMPLYAAPNFKRASDLDPNYRDAAYGWAYAL